MRQAIHDDDLVAVGSGCCDAVYERFRTNRALVVTIQFQDIKDTLPWHIRGKVGAVLSRRTPLGINQGNPRHAVLTAIEANTFID